MLKAASVEGFSADGRNTMSSFLKDYGITWIEKFCGKVLRQGPMPRHIGIIMDGNRRYAKDNNLGSVTEGHRKGDEKVSEVCKMMVDLGIPETTMYFFSLENFKRSSAEVGGLMTIFTEMMHRHLGELTRLEKNGYGVEIIGDYRKATTATLSHLFAKVMWKTKNHDNFRLNIAFAYSGQDEIARALDILNSGLLQGDLTQDYIDENLMEGIFTIGISNPPDFIIRTGGDRRLSDFMTWRGSNGHLEFMETVKWPEFTYCDLLKVIFRYQMQVTYYGHGEHDTLGFEKTPTDIDVACHETREFIMRWKEEMWRNILENATKI